jgi:hypothetical protein
LAGTTVGQSALISEAVRLGKDGTGAQHDSHNDEQHIFETGIKHGPYLFAFFKRVRCPARHG